MMVPHLWPMSEPQITVLQNISIDNGINFTFAPLCDLSPWSTTVIMSEVGLSIMQQGDPSKTQMALSVCEAMLHIIYHFTDV